MAVSMEKKFGRPNNRIETLKRQKNMAFVNLLLVTDTLKYAILKSGIMLQPEIKDREKEGKKGQ